MKKVASLFLVLFVLSLSVVAAQAPDTSTTSQEDSNGLSNVQKATNDALSKEINLSPQAQSIINLLFGIKSGEKLTTEKIIVMICIFIGLLIILQSILVITPFFEGKKSWAGAVIITLLISIGGAVNAFMTFLFSLANIFNILNKWRPLAVIFSVLVIFLLFYGVSQITKIMKKKIELEKAENNGMVAGSEIAKLKAANKFDK